MAESVYKTEIICQLEKKIDDGITILVYNYHKIRTLELFCAEMEKRNLCNVEIWYSIEFLQYNHFTRRISVEQMEDIMEIYRTFDFSDKVIVISESSQYGSLFNYVNIGVLTTEEMVDAILYAV